MRYTVGMRIHTSSKDDELECIRYPQPEPYQHRHVELEVGKKWKARPVGLWYSIDSDWLAHLTKEYPKEKLVEKFTGMSYEIHVGKECKLLKIDSVKSLEDMHSKYPEVAGDDWRRVAQDFDGIELTCIAELYEAGFDNDIVQEHFDWISKMEINSGCIWDMNNIDCIPLRPALEI